MLSKIIKTKKSTKYLLQVTCPRCEKQREVQSDRKTGGRYKNGTSHCKKCSMIIFRRKKRFIKTKDEVFENGSVIHWSDRDPNWHKQNRHIPIPVTCGKCLRKRFIKSPYGRSHLANGEPKPLSLMGYCGSCMSKSLDKKGIKHPQWKGGRCVMSSGYVTRNQYSLSSKELGLVQPMINKNGQILEHRLNMAIFLNRILLDKEIVHHLNGDKSDNRPQNLKIVDSESHPSENSTMWNILKDEINRLQILLDLNKISY